MDNNNVTYFAETDARNKRIKFGIKREDRSRHMYVIGKTGMGKSTLLENLAIQDIQNGEGIAFIDPHGKTAELLLEYVPEHRIKDVVYFAPFDLEHPISFNVMEDVGPERRHLVASGLMSAFKKIWVDAWSARMEYILGNIMLALLEYPGSTLIGVNRMLADKEYRNRVVANITDPSVRSFWVDEYAKYTDKFAAEAAPAIQNKVGQFVANPLVRNIIGQPKSSFDIRKIMDDKKILIINLSKGRVGEANANLLGSMIITKIYLAAMSRADLSQPELKKVPNFYLYVDEFQSFANESFADILSEARKYKLNLTIAHQYIEQMAEEVRAAVFGNVGTMVTFRVGAYDAEVLEKEFAPQFTAEDLVNLQQYQMYLKLMIDGVSSPPFSAKGMDPIQPAAATYVKEIIESSRKLYAHPRYEVEDEIRRWHEDKGGGGPASGYAAPNQGSSQGYGQSSGQSHVQSNQPRQYGPSFQGNQGPSRAQYAEPRYSQTPQSQPKYPPQAGPRDPLNRSFNKPSPVPYSSPRDGSRDAAKPPYPSSPADDPPRSNEHSRSNQTAFRPQTRSATEPRFQPAPERLSPRPGVSPSPTVPAQPRPQSQPQTPQPSRPAPRPFNDSERNKEGEARENDLRKAISLSYLKSENEQRKEDQKTAKPENIAALREALLAVMKDTQEKPEDQSEGRSERQPETRSERQPEKKQWEEKIPPQKEPQRRHMPENKDQGRNSNDPVGNNDDKREKADRRSQDANGRLPVNEVPADILKSLLDVKE